MDVIAERLIAAGVAHVFGVGGANIEDLFAAVQRRRPRIQAVLGKHEHAAVTAADAYARVTGGLGVVMATSGGGALNLVHGIAEARASSIPVLALVGEPPLAHQGAGAFQDISGRGGAVDGLEVFRPASRWCARVERAGDLPELLDRAIARAGEVPRGPSVLLIAKDFQQAELDAPAREASKTIAAPALPPEAARLLDGRAAVIVAGDEVARAGAKEALAALARALDAPVVAAPDGRDAFDNEDPRFLGVTGALGHAAAMDAVARAEVLVLAGTRLPFLARTGKEPREVLALSGEPPFVQAALHVPGDLRANLEALARARPKTRRLALAPPPIEPARGAQGDALALISRMLPERAVVLADAGCAGAGAVHHVRAPKDGRFLIAMGMAGMGWSFGAAVGAACAGAPRCVVLAGDGAFYMHGLDIHTAVERRLPITYVLLDNRAHGMCLVREHLLLREVNGYNSFRRAGLAQGLAAMFPGLPAWQPKTAAELEGALEASFATAGPSAIAVELDEVEVPPFGALVAAAGPGVTRVPRGG